MEIPRNPELPCFVYGMLKPGQLAFHHVREFVKDVNDNQNMRGYMRVRDGLPLLVLGEPAKKPEVPSEKRVLSKVQGAVLFFKKGKKRDAYRAIGNIIPDKHYRWDFTKLGSTYCNVLLGKSPERNSVEFEGQGYDARHDLLFTGALETVEETLAENQDFEWDLKPLFRLEMAYLLLWASIERFCALRYRIDGKLASQLTELAEERAFVKALRDLVPANAGARDGVDPESPLNTLHYYHNLRYTIAFPGKSVIRDYARLSSSLRELLAMFRFVLETAFEESRWDTETESETLTEVGDADVIEDEPAAAADDETRSEAEPVEA